MSYTRMTLGPSPLCLMVFLTTCLILLMSGPGCGRKEGGGGHGHGDEHERGDEYERGDEHEPDDEQAHGEGGGHSDEVKLKPEAIERGGIVIGEARKQPLFGGFEAPARVSYNADALAQVGSPVSGRVSELKAGLGARVNRGDVLLYIESPEYGEAQGLYRSRRTAADAARAAYQRARALFEKSQGISLGEVQKRESELKAAEAEVWAAEGRLKLFGLTAERIQALGASGAIDARYAVLAPLSGTVVSREVLLGELVNPERPALFTVADTSTLWVLADVPESRLKDVGAGSKARVKVPALPGRTFEGVVALVAPTLDPRTRTAEARVEVRDPEGLLRPAMFARAELFTPQGASEPVLAVPEEAIQTVEGVPAVFVPVEGEESTFAKRAVTVGRAVSGMVPVLSGLEEGERYVQAGTFLLKAELGKEGVAHEH